MVDDVYNDELYSSFNPRTTFSIVLDDDDDQPPVQVPAISSSAKPFMSVAKETPVNYWDDWRARETKEAERLLKKRKSEDDWGKFLF